MEKAIRTIFMGTPEFAVPPLKSLIDDPNFEIVAVFTNPDEPIGRKQILSAPPVKRAALENKLPLYQPLKIRDELETIKNLTPDLIIVVAYGHLIPQSILDIPKYGCINIHGSLLPKYRGAACLQAPLLNGDPESGITIMKMEAGLDTGPILRQAKIELTADEDIIGLRTKLSNLSSEILIPTLEDYLAGKIKEQKQDDSLASYVKMVKKEDGCLDFTKSALETERMIRAFKIWPGTWFNLEMPDGEKKKIQILEAGHDIIKGKFAEPGRLFKYDKQLALQCGQNALLILSLQIEGKNPISGTAFLNGYQGLIKSI